MFITCCCGATGATGVEVVCIAGFIYGMSSEMMGSVCTGSTKGLLLGITAASSINGAGVTGCIGVGTVMSIIGLGDVFAILANEFVGVGTTLPGGCETAEERVLLGVPEMEGKTPGWADELSIDTHTVYVKQF